MAWSFTTKGPKPNCGGKVWSHLFITCGHENSYMDTTQEAKCLQINYMYFACFVILIEEISHTTFPIGHKMYGEFSIKLLPTFMSTNNEGLFEEHQLPH